MDEGVNPRLAALFRELGSVWDATEDVTLVRKWLASDCMRDSLVRFAFGFTRNLGLAEDAVSEKISDVFDRGYYMTYDP